MRAAPGSLEDGKYYGHILNKRGNFLFSLGVDFVPQPGKVSCSPSELTLYHGQVWWLPGMAIAYSGVLVA